MNKAEWEALSPEEKAKRRASAYEHLAKANEVRARNKALKYDNLAQFIALNPFASVKEALKAVGLGYTPEARKQILNILAQPAMVDKVAAYKPEFVNPMVAADIGERYRTLAIQAVDKAQDRLNSKDCKDNTLVEILRVCSQYLAPKNAAVQINAGAGSLVGILSELQSSAQESLQKMPQSLPEKVINEEQQ